MTIAESIQKIREIGFKWDANSIGIKFDNGYWNVNVVLLGDDGTRKRAYGFLKYDSVADAVAAKREMSLQ